MSFNIGELIFEIGLKDGDFQKGIAAANTKMGTFADTATKTGKTLNTKVTLPLVALGGYALKAAADFEVSSRKFDKAFEGSGDKAKAAVKKLNDEYGIANSTSTKLLANTGDLLKGFGATSDEALTLSTSTQELAAQLGAYNKIPVAQASEIITKALLGERDSLVTLGTKVSEAAVQKQLLADGTANLTGEELLLAKAQATLKLITSQSTDAVGSFAENTDSAAFQTSALLGGIQDLAVQFGTTMLPVLKDVVGELNKLTNKFSSLSDEQKESIVKTAALLALLGPAVTLIGSVTTAVKGLSTAFAFLAANPVVAATIAIAALGVIIGVAASKANEKRVDTLVERFDELGKSTGVAEDKMREFAETAGVVENALRMNDAGAGLEDVAEQVGELAKNLGLTKDQVIEVGLQSDNLSDSFKESLGILKDQRQETKDQIAEELKILTVKGNSAKVSKEIVKSEELITAELIAQKKLNKEIETKYQTALGEYKKLIDEQRKGSDIIQDQIDAYEKLDKGSVAYEEARLEAIKILKAKKAEAIKDEKSDEEEKNKKILDFNEEYFDKLDDLRSDDLTLLRKAKDKAVKEAEELGGDVLAVEEYFNKKEIKLTKELLDKKTELDIKDADGKKDRDKKDADEALKEQQDLMNDISKNSGVIINIVSQLATATMADVKKMVQDTVVDIGDSITQIGIKSGNALVVAAGLAITLAGEVSKFIDAMKGKNEELAEDQRKLTNQIAGLKYESSVALAEKIYNLELKSISDIEKSRLDAYLSTLSEKEIAALKTAGVIEQTNVERINAELQAAKDAGDTEQINLLTNQLAIEKIRKDAQDAKDVAEKTYKNKIARYEYNKAIVDKNVRMQEVIIAHEKAQADMPWYASNKERKSVKAQYQAIINIIGGIAIPAPVYLAKGGIVNPSAGGTNAVIGEAGSPEAVMPLNDNFFKQIAKAALSLTQGSAGSQGTNSDNTVINMILDGKVIGTSTVNLINNRQLTIDSRSIR